MLLLILWTETLIGGLLNLEGFFWTKMQIPATDWEKSTGFYSTIRILDLAVLCFWLQK